MVYEFTSDDSNTYTYGHRLLYSDDYKYVLNAHGNVVALLNSDGETVKEYDYDAFGNELNPSASDTNPFRYCAEYFDVESGQIYLRNRYYQPVTGRFSQLDPIRDGLNWYAYCVNNPIMYLDPLGLEAHIIYDIGDEPDQYMVEEFFQYLSILSDDVISYYTESVYFDKEGNVLEGDKLASYKGKITEKMRVKYYIVEKSDNPTKKYGTELVADILDNNNNIVEFKRTQSLKKGTRVDFPGTQMENVSNGIGTSAELYYYFNGSSIAIVEGNTFERVPGFVAFAHELIHASNIIHGTRVKPNKVIPQAYISPYGDLQQRDVTLDEYMTVGLKDGYKITENRIRAEHNLKSRIVY